MTFPSLPEDPPEVRYPSGTFYWDDPDSEWDWVVTWDSDAEHVLLEDTETGIFYPATDWYDDETVEWLFSQIGD